MLTGQLAPWPCFTEEEAEAVSAVLLSNRVNYWTGEQCRSFEDEFAAYCDVPFAISLANGTVALELALEAAGIGSGDEVIVTPRTFIASASCVVRCKARPVFADVSIESQNFTLETVRSAITPSTKAIIAVHHAGWPCDMPALMKLAADHDLMVIEDCAQAHGARIAGKVAGSFGHFAAFSFCQDKIMTTGGEGGMLVTSDKVLWSRAWSLKDHGKSYDQVFNRDHPPGFRWLHESFGTNGRMTEMQAAIGRIQLRKLDHWVADRNGHARTIMDAIGTRSVLRVPRPPASVVHAYYRLYAFVEDHRLKRTWDRDRIAAEINKQGIPCLTGSCSEIYREKAFARRQLEPATVMANARELGKQSLAFLVHPNLSDSDMRRSCEVIVDVLDKAAADA